MAVSTPSLRWENGSFTEGTPKAVAQRSRRAPKIGSFGNVDDAVDLYLNEIGRVDRIDHADEIHLSRAVRNKIEIDTKREELTEELGHPPSTDELTASLGIDEGEMRRRIHKGKRAQQTLINANLRLVVSVAKKYVNRGVPFLDLIQEGNIGLIRATERFDAERGYRFSTYAHWWIRQGVTRCIANQARTIRLPVHMVDKVRHLKRAMRDLSKEFGRRPTEEELAEALGVKVKKLRTIQQSASLPISLDMTVGPEGETRLGDLLEDRNSDRPFQEIVANAMQQDVHNAMDILKPMERDVLRMRYGFDGSKGKTLREVGEHFDLTRERIRQIEKEALRKLRSLRTTRRSLDGYL